MQDAWYLEVLDDDGRPRARVRLDGPLTAGRALSCALVLDDPSVSPEHFTLEPAGDGWTARDRDSLNGLYRLDPPRRVPSVALADGLLFQAGRTVLRARWSGAPLAPTAPLDEAPEARRWFEGPGGAVLAWALFFLAVALRRRAGEFQETSLSRLAGAWIVLFGGLSLAGAVWTGLWALLERLVAGRRNFWGHAAAAGAGAFLFLAASSAFGWAAFALNLSGAAGALGWLATGAAAAWLLRAHLRRLALPPRRAARLGLAAAAVLWGLSGAASYFFGQRYSPSPRFDVRIKPAWARLAPPVGPEAWLGKLSALKDRADDLAKKK